jgi:CheY-like chemotaxis protein
MPYALIVDDSRQMADSLSKMLKILGFETETAYGARTGILAIGKRVPDVIFLDVNMPGLDGFNVLAYFRRLPHLKDIPVIVVTSDDQPETASKAKNLGVSHLIIKPASLDSIERALRIVGLPKK